MSMTDPIADLLTRIRNAHRARHATVRVPASKIKLDVVRIMADEGYIEAFEPIDDGKQGTIEIRLKYLRAGRAAITGMQRVSRVGRRVYRGKEDLPHVLGGLGVTIVSTPKGVMTGRACHDQGVGGEVLCNIW
jgi:small subunit ribosomal protein S8